MAPTLDLRPNIHVPDAETLKALVAHRFQAMTDYQRNVLKPALREEAAAAGEKLKRLQAWCAEAEASGVRALQDYAARLRGYALVPA